MAQLLFLNQYFTTTLNVGGGINDSQTTGIIITDVTGVDTAKPGIALINYADPLNTTIAEWIEYTSINGSKEFVGVTRGSEGFSAKSHDNSVTVAFPLSESHINRIANRLTGVDTTLVNDSSGNEIIKTSSVASAVNEITITNSATTAPIILSATGGDTNIGMEINPKGTGVIQAKTTVQLTAFSPTADTATGDGKVGLRIPKELDGMNLIAVASCVTTAGTTGTTDVQIRRVRSASPVDMLSTKITIDSTEVDTSTAATPAVINGSNDDVLEGDQIYIDVDAVSTTKAKGLFVHMTFANP